MSRDKMTGVKRPFAAIEDDDNQSSKPVTTDCTTPEEGRPPTPLPEGNSSDTPGPSSAHMLQPSSKMAVESKTPERPDPIPLPDLNSSDTPGSSAPRLHQHPALEVIPIPAIQRMRQFRFASDISVDSELRGDIKLNRKKKALRHIRRFAEKTFRRINGYREACDRGELQWSENLYEVCHVGTGEMVGSGRLVQRLNTMVGVKALTAILHVTLDRDGLASLGSRHICDFVTNAILIEYGRRSFLNEKLLDEFMRYGAVDVFGVEYDFVVCLIMTGYKPFSFSTRRVVQAEQEG